MNWWRSALYLVAGMVIGWAAAAVGYAAQSDSRDDCRRALLGMGGWRTAREVASYLGGPLQRAYRGLRALEDAGAAVSKDVEGGPERGGRPRRLYKAVRS